MTDLLLMRATLREAFRPRRLTIAVLLILLPGVMGLIWRMLAPKSFVPAEAYDNLVAGLIFSFVLTILSVTYGTGVVAQEIEQRTIVYLLTRPLPRWRLLLARFLVSTLLIIGISVLSTLLLALVVFGPAHLAGAGLGTDLLALVLGALAYGSLFLLLGVAVPRSLIWGLLFVFGWETWVPILPGSFALLSIMSYLRALSLRQVSASPGANSANNFLSMFSSAPKVEIPSGQSLITLGAIFVICLAASMFIFSTREYVPREDAE